MKAACCFAVACSLFLLISPAGAVCPSTYENWSTSWSDAGSYTKYVLKAPKKVFIGCPFEITATVTDSTFPDNWVGTTWAVYDTYSTSSSRIKEKIAGSGVGGEGTNIWTQGGKWQRTYSRTYTGIPYDHRIEFSFQDLGSSSISSTSGMRWTGGVIGDVTLDPYLPEDTPPSPPGPAPAVSVPVFQGWWLIPGMLAGAGLLARRRKGQA